MAYLVRRVRDPGALEGAAHVRNDFPRRGPGSAQRKAALASFRQGRLDPGQVGGGLVTERSLPTHGGMRIPGEQALYLGPLDTATASD